MYNNETLFTLNIMNKTTKGISLAVAMFAIGGLMIAFNNQEAYARPQVAGVGDHVMTIHLKGVPNDTDRNCESGNNKNIYTMYDTHKGDIQVNHQHIDWLRADSNRVVDHCTENVGDPADRAEVEIKEGSYIYTIRILGPNKVTNEITYCQQAKQIHDADVDGDVHCILDQQEIRSNGKPSFSIPKNIFSDDFDDETWSLVTGSGFRNAQIDIWEAP